MAGRVPFGQDMLAWLQNREDLREHRRAEPGRRPGRARLRGHRMRCLIALLLLAALTWPATVPAAEKIKVTIPAAAVTFASLYQAKAAGYFADEGLDVEIVVVAGGGSLQA